MTELERILRNEREHLRVELEHVRALISTSEQRLTKIIERLRHVDGLLGDAEADSEPASHDPPLQETASIRFDGESVTDLAEKVLLQQPGKPMYYKDLAKEVQRMGGQIWATRRPIGSLRRMIRHSRKQLQFGSMANP